MMFPNVFKAAGAATVLLVNVAQTHACSCQATDFTPCDYVTGLASTVTTMVIRGTPLSMSRQVNTQGSSSLNTDTSDLIISPLQMDIGDNPVTYTMDVTTIFLGDTGGHDEITFVTAGNSAACGVSLEIGEEYVLALYPAVATAFGSMITEGELTVGSCGLVRAWSDIPDNQKDDLDYSCLAEDLGCVPACDEHQEECVQYQKNGKFYCSETCDNSPCDQEEEQCTTKPRNWCSESGFEGCPEKRRCRSV